VDQAIRRSLGDRRIDALQSTLQDLASIRE
jgi:hypothetical protein